VFKLNKDGSGYRILQSFDDVDAERPWSGLVEGTDGALYGTTEGGGTNGDGTVFRLSKDGSSYTVLHSFDDGWYPFATLLHGSDGALYGTTLYGGTGLGPGGGTLFKLNEDGTGYQVLHNFGDTPGDGLNPDTALVEGMPGTLFGMAGGTVFRLNTDGSQYQIIVTGIGSAEFWQAFGGGLLRGTSGTLFGATFGDSVSDGGTLFKVNEDGTGYSVLHSFSGISPDGLGPEALVEGSDGELYGTTGEGGASASGTVFKLDKDGSGYSRLHDFGATNDDGWSPAAGLVEGSDGAFYGTTESGGTHFGGTVFRLNKDGTGYAVLH
jgi:uncharacterized repeat protein (TIGR03803 family)